MRTTTKSIGEIFLGNSPAKEIESSRVYKGALIKISYPGASPGERHSEQFRCDS